MGLLDLNSKESISLKHGTRCPLYDNKIYWGYPFQTYLFFEISQVSYFTPLLEAKLILYKIPNCCERSADLQEKAYQISPLLDFFSIYNDWYESPKVDDNYRVEYTNQPCVSYSEIHITNIVMSWTNGTIENKGLLLTGSPYVEYLIYASNHYEFKGMRPMLRLTYEGASPSFSKADCTVEVR